MSEHSRHRFLTFRLSSLFLLMTAVALGTFLHVRAAKMHRICSELHGLRCPAIYTGSIPETEYETYCFKACAVSGPGENVVTWRGFAPAVVGVWEAKRFTVFVRAAALDPLYRQDERILELILDLPNLDTIVICAGGLQGGNPSETSEILEHRLIKPFVDKIRQHRPDIRVIGQPFVAIG